MSKDDVLLLFSSFPRNAKQKTLLNAKPKSELRDGTHQFLGHKSAIQNVVQYTTGSYRSLFFVWASLFSFLISH